MHERARRWLFGCHPTIDTTPMQSHPRIATQQPNSPSSRLSLPMAFAAHKKAADSSGSGRQAIKYNTRDIGSPDRSQAITRHEAEFRPLVTASYAGCYRLSIVLRQIQ